MIEDNKFNNYRIAVPAEFESVFSHFYFAENKSEEFITKTFLPSYQTILIFNFGCKAILHSKQNSQIEVEKCLILGPIKKAFDYSLPPKSEILVANFKDDSFYRFFGAASIAEHLPINPDVLLNQNCFTALWEELSKIHTTDRRIDFILKFCKPYLQNRNQVLESLTATDNPNLDKIKSVAALHNHTERNIQLYHKKYLGYSAKEINRYERFLNAVKFIQHNITLKNKVDWFEIVDKCGYYDQSQLIRDFKYYIDLSPTKYLEFQQAICNPKS